MVLFSISFLLISYVLTNLLGAVGFILANCCNMSARIGHSVYFIHKKYSSTSYEPLNGLKPTKYFIVLLVISAITTKLSEVSIGSLDNQY